MAPKIQDLIDIEQFQHLQDRLNEIYSFPSAIIDNDGKVLTATAWQDVCTKFHRRNPECEKECIKSDQYIADHLHEANPAVSYRCPHGLIDNATPIIIEGVHYGNFFTGQFFLEPPDLNFFKAQAKRYGFDEEAYLEAVRKAPIWTQEQLNSYLFFIKGLIEVIAGIGLKNLKDIEMRKRIRQSEEQHRTILQMAMDGIWRVDLQGRLLEVNASYCRMSGYSVQELLAMRIPDLEASETPDDTAAHIRKVMARGEDRFETRHRRKDGTIFDVEISVQYQTIDGGRLVAFLRDITERKRAEEEKAKLQAQLLQSQKMESVGRLAGGVAHDFNNMLGVILGHTELAMEQVDPDHPLYNDLREIRKAAERSSDLTRQLLAFARKQTIAPKVLDLNETVARMLKMLQRLIGEDIQLAWLPGVNLWPVRMDPSQIDQVLVNLSVNARDAIAGVGKITIETENIRFDETYCADHTGFVPGEYLLLAVSDDGCGMDREILGKLFEPFFTTKGAGKGTGLGLATCYGIVKQNSGFINVYSEPDRGTTFRIYLPRHIGKAEQIQKEGPQEPVIRGRETVLVVEDEEALLELGKIMIEKQGYRVLTAGTPGEAIRLAEEHPGEIHLLMTDVVMPEMNGRELARKMLSLYPNLKRLFMSGYTADVIAHHGVLDDGVHFIQKPFSRQDLAAKVREALDQA
jgi:PAS domain S-box-containing protein